MYNGLITGITIFALIGCFTFVLRYAILSGGAWLATEAGRFMMIVYATLGSLFTIVLLNQLFEEWPGRKPITVILFLAYSIFTWWPLRLLRRARSDKRVKQND